MAESETRSQKFESLINRLEKPLTCQNDREKIEAAKRLERLSGAYVCGAICRPEDPLSTSETNSFAGLATKRVFDELSHELLTSPIVLEQFLNHSQLRHTALSALNRIGPPAIAFAPALVEQLDRQSSGLDDRHWFDAVSALASIGRGNSNLVNAMIVRLDHRSLAVRMSAASVLESMAPEVCGRHDEICHALLPLLNHSKAIYSAIPALAAIGRDLPWVRSKILDLARPRPPRFLPPCEHTGEIYDFTMLERASAISALPYFNSYPDECVPVLIAAMSTFEEYDPDETYDGPFGRVANALGEFGPSAAAAVDLLAQHLRDQPDEMPKAILRALAKIGPAASSALPPLREYRQTMADYFTADLNITPVTEVDDPVGWTIQRITGLPHVPHP